MKKLIGFYFPKKYIGIAPNINGTIEVTVVDPIPLYCIITLPAHVIADFSTAQNPLQVTFTLNEQQTITYVSHLEIQSGIAARILEWARAPDIRQWAE